MKILGDAVAFWLGLACFALAAVFYAWSRISPGLRYFNREVG